MAPPGDDRTGEFLNQKERLDGKNTDDGQQWEDFTRVSRWEELVGCVEDVLRDWSCAEADEAPTNDRDNNTCSPAVATSGTSPPTNTSRARCLEHDGQLFSINLVVASAPPPELCPSPDSLPLTPSTASKDSKTAAPTIRATASRACDLDNPSLDFAAEGSLTPPQRWFGLKQYVLVRGLGKSGEDGVSDDQLLWASTVAAASCRCSIPVLVTCDWDGVEDEGGFGRERNAVGEGGKWRGGGGGASWKGYSAPGSRGTACSVRFQTAWTDRPPVECLYLDGLTELLLSKIKDAHCLPGRAFAPKVSTAVQQAWEWTKPNAATLTPAPGLPWGGAHWTKIRWGLMVAGARTEKVGEVERSLTVDEAPEAIASPTALHRDGRERSEAAIRLLSAVGGGDKMTPLWGPSQDPFEAICVRVRWTGLREGLAEESEHYTTLDPLPEEDCGSALGSHAGRWFVTARWRQRERDVDRGTSRESDGRLGNACARMLAAVLLASAMHPGTLMADLGAASRPDSPVAMAEDYGKAAADMLSADTRASVEKLCSNARSPPIAHDRIDLILGDLLRLRERVTAEGAKKGDEEPPPPRGVSDLSAVDRESFAAEPRFPLSPPLRRVHLEDAGEEDTPPAGATDGGAAVDTDDGDDDVGVPTDERESWWAGEGRGAAPVARLVSLLSLRMAECDDMRSMALLWMSFVRDVRLLWEDGATIARMSAVPEVDGRSMFDPSDRGTRGGTGQSRSVAARLRGERSWLDEPNGRFYRRRRRGHGDNDGLDGFDAIRGSPVPAVRSSAPLREEGKDPMYPDTRMCLVWQKLQMLNCCRVEEQDTIVTSAGVVAGAAKTSGVDARDARAAVVVEDGAGGEVEDDGEVFYDTLEYCCETSNGENDKGWVGGRVDGRIQQKQQQHHGGYDGKDIIEGSDSDGGSPPHPSAEDGDAFSVPHGEQTATTAATTTAEAAGAGAEKTAVTAMAQSVGNDESEVSEEPKVTGAGGETADDVGKVGADGTTVNDGEASPYTAPSVIDVAPFVVAAVSEGNERRTEPDAPASTTAVVAASASASAADSADGNVGAEDGRPWSEGFPLVADCDEDGASLAVTALVCAGSLAGTATEKRQEGQEKENGEESAEETIPGGTGESLQRAGTDVSTSSTPSVAAAVAAMECSGLSEPRLLLRTGAVVRPPRLQPSGPVTRDMLEQQELGQARAYRERAVLRADMEAFLEENRGAVFADFVRWYRPDCWKDAASSSEGMARDADSSGSGGGAEDDRRLAWPGRGQVLWKNPNSAGAGNALLAVAAETTASDLGTPPCDDDVAAAADLAGLTLAGWLSCWRESRATGEERERGKKGEGVGLFNPVKEGEKALHYLETIPPAPLLLQLLSALLGLSVTLLEEAASASRCSLSTQGLPVAQEVVASARRKVAVAMELLAAMTAEVEGGTVGGGGAQLWGTEGQRTGDEGAPPLSFPRALLAADAACLELKKAETTLARAVSLERALSGQQTDLANAIIVACQAGAEASVVARPHKEFLRDLLLTQGAPKTPGVELEDLLASYDDHHQSGRKQAGIDSDDGVEGKPWNHGGSLEGSTGGGGAMPPPHFKEYVLRCQTPAPFYGRNLGREQMAAYPTPSSRMYAKTDGRHLRVAVSLCESEI